eukprot:Gregarina_sp_Poly_1__4915@NODE_2607_length_1925_cov_131_324543_g130_i1_p1_GENE_NODE_2607_length_1925_cov_131_324543_g130_i1NODE_2607_length_1925_cov_131_324543_g130_i1_p1_ORF_typecomplete_len354_score50_19DUF900/PF05990_12/3e26Lipase/PF00151_19/0_00017Lipase_2/PF01674_18/0_024Abhydrolase_1/PF00561_20/8_9e02Abhydrolase_1/PF00561_20/0_082Abhydrolase_6/PF12697_7/2_5e03Abhydrolase_6/PF12697_7/0_088LCAT/PF02450_15/0_19Peptidase_C11/PF03415_14/0_25_NODE_2607_length_1925_cov_131_324543_g130_i13671428
MSTTRNRWVRGTSLEARRANSSMEESASARKHFHQPQRSWTQAAIQSPRRHNDKDSRPEHSDPVVHFLEDAIASSEARIKFNKYHRAMTWVIQQLHPHTPAFGLNMRSEIIISVDRERGLDILGFVPVSQIYLEEDQEDPLDDLSHPPTAQSLEISMRLTEGSTPRKRQRLAPVAEMNTATSITTPRRQVKDSNELHVKVEHQSAIAIARMAKELDPELERESEELKVNVQAPELSVKGWVAMGSIGISEVLVYVHGYNNTHSEATQTLGQMATFGNFPPHLKVIVFTWPAGSGLTSFFQALKNSEDNNLHVSFRNFLRSLLEAGIRQFHVLCHSMGARLFLKSIKKICRETE